ncbi:hypothetical protein OZX72_00080 [Bifidobacterium sp. ESL0769]|uniref:hypothetical protein n=1 Tax=Bifidobacterium sp. ESL0769 TaxID=2983229 RepID=UPI0023F632E9|nr:hypothetical protein [Bifidobacterium sp. ESL0769]WEV67453.1 hypothetical protein OZX72_00080 [Bifidobacterium sp. ESL0769]
MDEHPTGSALLKDAGGAAYGIHVHGITDREHKEREAENHREHQLHDFEKAAHSDLGDSAADTASHADTVRAWATLPNTTFAHYLPQRTTS